MTTLSGSQHQVAFGRSERGLSDVVVQYYRGEAQKRRFVHASWGGGGATFLLAPEGSSEKVLPWSLDEGVNQNVTISMLFAQALGELEVSLGHKSSLQYADPRPEWSQASFGVRL